MRGRRKIQSIKGGRLIGVGGYGCVFKPSFQSNSDSSVTKILLKEDADIEYNISNYLYQFDRNGLYGSYITTKTCNTKDFVDRVFYELQSTTKQELKGLKAKPDDCQDILRNPDMYCVLDIPTYTHDLDDYVPSLTKQEILTAWQNLFRALVWVHNHGVVHLDIKPNNIAYQASNPVQHCFIFADWGLSSRVDDCDGLDYTDPDHPAFPLKSEYSCAQVRNLLFMYDILSLGQTLEDFLEYYAKSTRLISAKSIVPITIINNRLDDDLLSFVSENEMDLVDLYIRELEDLKYVS